MITHCFTRPSGKKVSGEELVKICTEYIAKDPMAEYEITVGTDSQDHKDVSKVVEVITVRNIGKGGIFFYSVEYVPKFCTLKQKIENETMRSLNNANGLLDEMQLQLIDKDIDIDKMDIKFQIHCDIGHFGKTSELIKEITNWVHAYGYECLIKPDSYTANAIADKYSK